MKQIYVIKSLIPQSIPWYKNIITGGPAHTLDHVCVFIKFYN